MKPSNTVENLSLFNLFNVLPMLGKPPIEYPQFINCFLGNIDFTEYHEHIHVITKTGGENRKLYEKENQAIREMPDFVTDFDDPHNPVFATWVFSIPARWRDDYKQIVNENLKFISLEYQNEIRRIYPNTSKVLDTWFSNYGIEVNTK